MLVTVQALDKHRDAPLDVKLVHYGHVEAFYRPMYAGFSIHPQHAAAYRTVLSECRDRAVKVVLLRMPETPRFRSLQTPESERLGDGFLAELVGEFGVPVTDARTWADEPHLPDGFHLTQPGAEVFTRRLLPEVRRQMKTED